MNVVGLIVEYNPLHNGHLYHFQRSKEVTEAEAVVVVMSGNFLQRGEPALVNKWARAKMALAIGADLVFELPYVYATQRARYFAFGAVSLLNQLPFVTHLCFGSESGEMDQLKKIANLLADEPPAFQQVLRQEMEKGTSYPSAYARAILASLPNEAELHSLVSQPNNILALHYLLALKKLNSKIEARTIKREKSGYHDEQFKDEKIASATSIRKALFATKEPNWLEVKSYLPESTLAILQEEYDAGRGLISWEDYYSYILHTFFSQSPAHLRQIYEMEEGIEHRFKQKILEMTSVKQLIHLVKTKRYTWNRIQRIMVHTLAQFTKEEAKSLQLEKGVQYLRLLGYSKRGQALLNQYKKELAIPLISAIRKEHPPMLDWDIKASLLHSLAYRPEASFSARKREVSQPPISWVSGQDNLRHPESY